MTYRELEEMVLHIAVRDLHMTHKRAEDWYAGCFMPRALEQIALAWWIQDIHQPEEAEIRKQLAHLTKVGVADTNE
jgi:hypothetical protein